MPDPLTGVQPIEMPDSETPSSGQNIQVAPESKRDVAVRESKEVSTAAQPAQFKEEPTFEFAEKTVSPSFDLLSLQQEERNLDIALAKYNRGVFDKLPPIEDIKGAVEYVDNNKFGYKALKAQPALIKYYENKGKIGFGESWQRMNKWGIIPYIGDVSEIVEDVSIFRLVRKANAGKRLDPGESEKLQEFAQDMIEVNIRGHSFGGKMLEGVYKLPAFAIEFLTAGGVIKQVFKQSGLRAGKLIAKKGMQKYIKSKIARGVVKVATEGALRTVLNPVSVTKSYMNRKLNDSVVVTDRGEIFFKESEEKPATTFVKALGDVFVEQASETAGSYLFKPIGNKIAKIAPKSVRTAFSRMTKGEMGLTVREGVRKFGYDGFLEEIGEERLGDFLRTALDLDPEEGYSIDQFGNALFPDWEDLLVEAGVIGFHGTFSKTSSTLLNKLYGKEKVKSPESAQRLADQIEALTESQKVSVLEAVEAKETLEDVAIYESQLELFEGQVISAGMGEKYAKRSRALYDAFATVSAAKLGKKRSELFNEFAPSVIKGDKAPGVGKIEQVFQEAAKTPEFKKWFEGSKVVDSKGDPLVVYHGTKERFTEFDRERAIGSQFWFTTDKSLIEKGEAGAQGSGVILETYLSIKNPANWSQYDKYGIGQLEEMGHDGIELKSDGEATYIAFEPNQIKDISNLKPTQHSDMLKQGRKGYYDITNKIIGILPNADKSTFVHETAHVFFDFYLNNLPQELSDVYKWAGLKADTPIYDAEGTLTSEGRRMHEAFARGFETYLAEGRAPNARLAQVFEDFKNWLLSVYDSVFDIMTEGDFDFSLSKDVRQLYADMLNVDQDIIIDTGMKPIFKKGGVSGLPVAYQTAKERISELRRERSRVLKKYGKKKVAELAEVDDLISSIEEEIKTDYSKLEQQAFKKELKDIQGESYIGQFKEYLKNKKVYLSKEDFADYQELSVAVGKQFFTRDAEKGTPLDVVVQELSSLMGRPDWADNINVFVEEMTSAAQGWLTPADIKEQAKQSAEETGGRYEEESQAVMEEKLEDVSGKLSEVIEKLKADAKARGVTQLQKEVIKFIRKMDISAIDKIKLLGRIQKAKTPYSQRNVMFELYDQEQKFWEKRQREILNDSIQKMLSKTKPKLQGGITKGKYRYEDNELFTELRRINKMTQEAALKEADFYGQIKDSETISEKEAFVRQFTMYKAYGKSKGSLELFEVVHNNLERAISIAKQSKDEKDFNDSLNKRRRTEKVLEGIDSRKYKGDAKSFMTKLVNVYRLGFTNIQSMMNSVAGKDIAEELNPELAESKRNTATYNQIRDTVQDAMLIYDLKNPHDFIKVLDRYAQEEYSLTEQIERYEGREGIKHTFDRMGIIDIYNATKNEKNREDYYRVYGEANVLDLVNNLTEQEKQFADMLMQRVQGYREAVNKKHIEQTGVDMGNVSEYWPATSQKPKDTLLDNMKTQGSLPSFVKARASGGVVPIPNNAWNKYSKHIAAAEHMINLQDSWRNLRQIFDSETIKGEIRDKYGDRVNKVIRQQIDGISLNQITQEMDEVSGFFGKVLGNWIKAKISLNPSVFVKQLISVGNYMEDMPVVAWNKYFLEGMISPKKTKDFMWKHAEFLEARFKRGYSEDIERAQREAKKLSTSKRITEALTALVRMGDIGAITYGGFPVIQYLTKEKGYTLEEAFNEFEKRTLRAQQSPLASSLAPVQMSKNPFVNFFFAFKNTPTQYMRKMADAIIMFRNGDISLSQFTKTMTIYGAIQPALFGLVTQLMRSLLYDDEDDYVDDVIGNILTSPLNAIPLISDINKYAVNSLIANATGGKKPWKVFSTPVMGDVENWISVLERGTKKGFDELDIFEFIKLASLPLELGVGLPVQTLVRPVEKRSKKK